MAIADVYDALVSKRVYKPAMPHDQAVCIVAAEAGTHFDPELSAIFMEVAAQFRDISEELSDESPENAVT